ncbi:MAG: NAD(P)/FAD-dependent oxidoreductase [Ignavibacteriales bacterium]|nr:NAD(P)/FAD-dependent oxidoreductase [Ignavibacteriales bacterium]MCF8305546.1 NAD(P)/FAD-dependent oxidoreductase [Ignavibacteriales bacterium]MCF8315268.1 NAD(P)/FAD-dependent oxidoreductase [Ignavibacteriales bacterium]MCF8436840.1 NAD(P)/FAD-dependent oxidoreductase [Ignavibacteriales bacterium]
MAKLVILGAGIAGHTAALHAYNKMGKKHTLTVVSPNSKWNWIPSNIWVGVGVMTPEQVTFNIKDVYKKLGINFVQAKAVSVHPEGDESSSQPYIIAENTSPEKKGTEEKVNFDYLLNATGPKLKFEATEGLGPAANSLSVCTYDHAAHTWEQLKQRIEMMKKGEKQTFLVGTGHGMCTCQGAAFEYIFNLEHVLRREGVRNQAQIIWISNEQELGDFGMGGMHIKKGGYITHSRIFTESLYTERGIKWITRAHLKKVDKGEAFYETIEGEEKSVKFDFSMLLPPFSGVGLKAFGRNSEDITSKVFAPNGFMIVDGNYEAKEFSKWSPEDWPSTYQSPIYKNMFAVGIAFAPPHSISKPAKSPSGTPIFPTPPRTGMPSGVMAREVVYSILDMMNGRSETPTRKASMAKMGAACIASAGASPFNGSAVSMTVYPIVPDFNKYPDTGRSLNYTTGEIGLAGHWIKHLLHYAFIYKAKANPMWRIVPE